MPRHHPTKGPDSWLGPLFSDDPHSNCTAYASITAGALCNNRPSGYTFLISLKDFTTSKLDLSDNYRLINKSTLTIVLS